MQPAKDTLCSGSGEPSLGSFLNHSNAPILTFYSEIHFTYLKCSSSGFFARAQIRQLKQTFRNSTEDKKILSEGVQRYSEKTEGIRGALINKHSGRVLKAEVRLLISFFSA